MAPSPMTERIRGQEQDRRKEIHRYPQRSRARGTIRQMDAATYAYSRAASRKAELPGKIATRRQLIPIRCRRIEIG